MRPKPLMPTFKPNPPSDAPSGRALTNAVGPLLVVSVRPETSPASRRRLRRGKQRNGLHGGAPASSAYVDHPKASIADTRQAGGGHNPTQSIADRHAAPPAPPTHSSWGVCRRLPRTVFVSMPESNCGIEACLVRRPDDVVLYLSPLLPWPARFSTRTYFYAERHIDRHNGRGSVTSAADDASDH